VKNQKVWEVDASGGQHDNEQVRSDDHHDGQDRENCHRGTTADLHCRQRHNERRIIPRGERHSAQKKQKHEDLEFDEIRAIERQKN